MIRTALITSLVLASTALFAAPFAEAQETLTIRGHKIVGQFCIKEYRKYGQAQGTRAFASSGDGYYC